MSDDRKTFEQLQSLYGHLTFEEQTGEPFEPLVRGVIVDAGDSGYGTIQVSESKLNEDDDES